jgi:hypothetical protein
MYDHIEENLRTFVDPRGKFNIKREDPYGLWVVTQQEGGTPAEFKDHQFTSADKATSAIISFLNNKEIRGPKRIREVL